MGPSVDHCLHPIPMSDTPYSIDFMRAKGGVCVTAPLGVSSLDEVRDLVSGSRSGRYPTLDYEDLLTVSASDLRWIRNAMKVAGDGEGGYRLGAVVVKSGSVLSSGSNRRRNDPATAHGVARSAWSVHAEDACLRGIRPGRARGATLYVARVSVRGAARLARPCASCQGEALGAGITKMVYTTTNGVAAERINSSSLIDVAAPI